MNSIERAYRILGLRPGSSREEVHRAYRDLAQVWHPDRFTHNPRLQEKAAQNTRRINDAYRLLRDHEPEAPTSSGIHARLNETFGAVLGRDAKIADPERERDRVGRAESRGRHAPARSSRPPERSSRRSRRPHRRSGPRRSGRSGSKPGSGVTGQPGTRGQRRARPDQPADRPSGPPPPVVGIDAVEPLPVEERPERPVAIWLVLALSVLLLISALVFL